jgi:nuclear polyadenylated RNA-binding protein 3
MTSGHYPDEPHLRSEIALLSPASPKPLHFPAPTNIPVLDNMMDVGFNQTEVHMADPAMHNTELRPGAWQDPNAPKEESARTGEEVATQAAPAMSDNQAAYQASARDTLPNMPTSQNAGPQGVSDGSVAQPTASYVPTPTATESASHHADFPAQPSEAHYAQSSATPLNGDVDVQALLNTLQSNAAQASSTPAGDALHVATALSPSQTHQPRAPGIDSSPVSAAGLGAPPSGLPPRPPPQEQPLINANYSHSQHIRDYHPHAANPAYQNNTARSSHTANSVDPSSQAFVPPVHVSSESAPPGTEASFGNPSSTITHEQQAVLGATVNRMQGSTPLESRREYKIAAGLNLSDDDQPWTPDTQRKYDKFIEDERKYVSEGRWEQFPYGSRLFVGNLSSERVTKRDIFHAFHRYGDLAQISIKQAYGFVQFLRPQDCSVALTREEGRQIRGKKIRECTMCDCVNISADSRLQTWKLVSHSVIVIHSRTPGPT